MAKFMAKVAGFVDSTYREPGEIFDYFGDKPGHWMMPISVEEESAEPKSREKTPNVKEDKAKAKSSRASDQSVI
jgi:hypothetical protein